MKKLLVTIAVMAVVGGLYAQQNDTIASTNVDTVSPKHTMELQEVGITAKKPVYMTDGEKTLYNVSEDPAVQTGTAADALQNAPGVEVDVEGNVTLRGVSSVEIWLNNKPANMNAEALKLLLQQMPASDIEKIEVITNPSARYSAQGTGGIINIVTVSNIKKNSFLSFGAKGSSSPDVTPFISYVYADRKFSISTYLHYWYSTSRHDTHGESSYYDNDGSLSSHSQYKTVRRFKENQIGLFVNASYTPDTANVIYVYGGFFPMSNKFTQQDSTWRDEYIYQLGNYSYTEDYILKSRNFGGYIGLWYEHQFNPKGHKISASAFYQASAYKSQAEKDRDYLVLPLPDWTRQENWRYNSHNLTMSLDYSFPYHAKGILELGVSGSANPKYQWANIDSLVHSFTDNYYVKDNLRSYTFYDNPADLASYVTVQHQFGRFTIKGGLRAEYALRGIRYPGASDYSFQRHFWGLFPSLHLSYRTKNMHNFKLSYTRRVNNPQPSDLTAYCTYSDDSFSKGNPDLKQAFTNSVEAGWTKYIRKFGNVGINAWFKNTKDEFSPLTDVCYDPFFGRIVPFAEPINAGRTLNTGAEVNVTYQLKTFMSIRFYGNVYYMKSAFQFRNEEKPYIVDNLGYSFRLNFWAKLWKVLEINAAANYQSQGVTLFTTVKPRYSIDLGLKAEFWKHRIAIWVNVDDLFDWNRSASVSDNPYYSDSSSKRVNWQARTIRFGLSFKFGKMELESAQAGQGQGERK